MKILILILWIIVSIGMTYFMVKTEVMTKHENQLAQECLNLRYQIDVLTGMVSR